MRVLIVNTNLPETNTVKTGARLLETLTSALYADPIIVFREYVQNAIDSFADAKQQERDFKVEITLSPQKIIIRDNGDGISFDQFNDVMMSLGKSSKDGRKNQIGFRGIGRLAGLSFCNELQFINKVDPKNPQIFVLNGDEYRKILSEETGGNLDLDTVMNRIKKSNTPQGDVVGDWTFEVTLEGISDELKDCIYLRKPKRGRVGKQADEDPSTAASAPTEEFTNALSMLLPVPYADGFKDAEKIRAKYQEWFNEDLTSREFKVFLDGKQLHKPFITDEQRDFRIIPIRIKTIKDQLSEEKTIGLLWMSFDYVFKAMKKDFGIAVRSKNMLVRGGSVLAEEAANSRDAITTYGQYLSAVKGVTGELLLETDFLSDNSRRDWFKVDAYSLQLRDQLCQLMNWMHNYRYKISRYMHNDMRTDADKQQVVAAYRNLVSEKGKLDDVSSIERYMESGIQQENKQEKDDRADDRDILGYTTTEKRFYRKLMLTIYNYFESKEDKEITDYYALKLHVLRSLNRSSIEPEIDESSQENN